MLPRAALCVVLLAGAACSTKTIIAVDPFPCSDAGITGCGPGLLDDLVGYWKLNDKAGSTTAADSSSWGNDGTLTGLDAATAWITDSSAPGGAALSIEGKGHVTVPPSSSIDSITSQVTMSAWMYLDASITDYATAISRQIAGGSGYGQLYHVGVNNNLQPVTFITPGPESNQLTRFAAAMVPQKKWFHIASTYNGSTVAVYLNGVQVDGGNVSGTFTAQTTPVILSGNVNAGTVNESIPGRLAEVRLYRRALPAADIMRLYQAGLTSAPHPADAGGQ
jgi:hypothetical protein